MAIEIKQRENEQSEEEELDSDETESDEPGYTSEDRCICCINKKIDEELNLLSVRLENLESKLLNCGDTECSEIVSDLFNSVQQIQELNSNLKE